MIDDTLMEMSRGRLNQNSILKAVIGGLLVTSFLSGAYFILVVAPEGCENTTTPPWEDERSIYCLNVLQISVYSAVMAVLIAIWMVPEPPKRQKSKQVAQA